MINPYATSFLIASRADYLTYQVRDVAKGKPRKRWTAPKHWIKDWRL